MEIRFWGVRGSIASPMNELQLRNRMLSLLEYASRGDLSAAEGRETILNGFTASNPLVIGGNTACIELRADDKILIFDMGTGIRHLGNYLQNEDASKKGLEIHIFISHTHWDHIQGFPFFAPAYEPQNKIKFYSVHPGLRERMELQQDPRFFPVAMDQMSCQKEFIQLEENECIMLGNLRIRNMELYHPGKSYSYSVEEGSSKFVFASDSEFKDTGRTAADKHIEFFRNASLLVFDAQYTFTEAIRKEDWGHSTSVAGIDLSVMAGVKKIALFHHDPDNDSNKLLNILAQAVRYRKINFPDKELEIILATEGLRITM
ncbi:MAG: MBL fold metallo-hydrolase [Ignavibacteriales bacterium]